MEGTRALSHEKEEAEAVAKALIQKNVDDFYHRAWVIESNNLTK